MSRLVRPYIPISVRLAVAKRQQMERFGFSLDSALIEPSQETHLHFALTALFGYRNVELHHRPALVNRRRKRNGDYDPPANDPNHLVYLVAADHDIETRVRGLRGQHSDLALARKRKRSARKRDPKRKRRTIPGRKFDGTPIPSKLVS